ncbi:MAG: LSm family protein [Nanoarchaeota archaeon]|nr:small nuclear ribonucleoprotein [Nanoarchaeota archaeon]MBU4300411.1 small nuclear ribonucleoprotein [Nanoarchaeota archaeon]MBU4451363.1 small nuclear ribonucleoprotein [Nanoarchaeota archaeon]
MSNRPLDLLDNAKGKRVIVKLKNNRQISGILRALDIHLNMWIDDAEVAEEDKTTKYGKVLVRGDSIIFASPTE